MSKQTIKSLGPTGRVTRAQIRAAVAAVRAANKGKKYPVIRSAAETASGRGEITFRFVHFFEHGMVPTEPSTTRPHRRRKSAG